MTDKKGSFNFKEDIETYNNIRNIVGLKRDNRWYS